MMRLLLGTTTPLIFALNLIIDPRIQTSGISWTTQQIRSSINGMNRGAALADINLDGAGDIIFAAGRDTSNPDQPYALINLGKNLTGNNFLFSSPVNIGSPGAYQSVDVAILTSGEVRVLLSGGPCVGSGCSKQPAVLLNITVSDCGFATETTQTSPCSLESHILWEEPSPKGGALAAFSMGLANDGFPAIVLAGDDGLSVFESNQGTYSTATFTLSGTGLFSTISGLDVGYIGEFPGLLISASTGTSGLVCK